MLLNRYVAIFLAAMWILSIPLPEIQAAMAVDSLSGLQVFVTLMAAMVILERPLARLSFEEVSRELAAVSLEEATETFWRGEQQLRRDAEPRK